MTSKGLRALLLLTVIPPAALSLFGCTTTAKEWDDRPHGGPIALESTDFERLEVDHLLDMEPGAGGYQLGSEFRQKEPGNEGFEYRGRQAGHVIYHRKLRGESGERGFTDILLHIDAEKVVNKIVLLRQFSALEPAEAFFDRQYRRQREGYYLVGDSGNSGTIRFATVEAYPDRESRQAAYDRYRASHREKPFLYYYHPLIARRTASFVYVRGVPTVALIYESHNYEGEGL